MTCFTLSLLHHRHALSSRTSDTYLSRDMSDLSITLELIFNELVMSLPKEFPYLADNLPLTYSIHLQNKCQSNSVCLFEKFDLSSASTRFQILKITLPENLNDLRLRCRLILVRGWDRKRRREKCSGTYAPEVSHIPYSLLVPNADLLDICERLNRRRSDLGSVGDSDAATGKVKIPFTKRRPSQSLPKPANE